MEVFLWIIGLTISGTENRHPSLEPFFMKWYHVMHVLNKNSGIAKVGPSVLPCKGESAVTGHHPKCED